MCSHFLATRQRGSGVRRVIQKVIELRKCFLKFRTEVRVIRDVSKGNGRFILPDVVVRHAVSLRKGLTPVGNEFIEYGCQLFANRIQPVGHVNIVKVAEGSGAGERLCAFAFCERRDDVNAVDGRCGFLCLFRAFIVLLTPGVGFGEVVFTENDVMVIRKTFFQIP
ncbi:hypothetical protein D3C87_1617170 [compost metagenome]